jgi:hypothetical protein
VKAIFKQKRERFHAVKPGKTYAGTKSMMDVVFKRILFLPPDSQCRITQSEHNGDRQSREKKFHRNGQYPEKYKLNYDEPIDSKCLQTAFRVFSFCGYPFRTHEIIRPVCRWH